MKFILTSELNKLAKKLRFIGYNSTVNRSLSSHTLVRVAIKEHRIALTRSKKLFNDKRQFERILIHSSDPQEQFMSIVKQLNLNADNAFTICSECNHNLYSISKERIAIKLPSKVLENYDEYKYCRHCGKYYWKGTHYINTLNQVKSIKESPAE